MTLDLVAAEVTGRLVAGTVIVVAGKFFKILQNGSKVEISEKEAHRLLKCKAAKSEVNLASPKRTTHILDGDATGGGHRAGTGIPNKSEFPASWSDSKAMHEISDVATDPKLTWTQGKNGRYTVQGTRDGVDIKVVIEKDGSDIVSGYPTNTPRNP
jgi:hypothetical protein